MGTSYRIYFCLPFRHHISFYKNSLAAEIFLILSEAERSRDKSKMIYLNPGERKLIKISLFLFGLVCFPLFTLIEIL